MARPIWTGNISFGLVNIPMQLVMAVHEKHVALHMLSPDGSCRLRRKLYCPETGKEFDFNQTSRGVEVGPNEYVLVEEKELRKIKPEKGRTMQIEQFVDLKEIDPIYFDRPYFVTPKEEGAKAFKLLVEAMKESGKCGIARFVMREREYLCCLRPTGHGMVLHTMHYADEVEDLEESVPAAVQHAKLNRKEVQVGQQLIEALAGKFDVKQFKDEYREKLEKLVEAKAKGKKTVDVFEEEEAPPPRTLNLMEALKRSLEANKPRGQGNGHEKRRRSA